MTKKQQKLIKLAKKIGLAAVLLGVLIGGLFFWSKSPSSPSIFKVVFGSNEGLKKDNGRINVLLLGMAGGSHQGATLTDTIMVASINEKTKQAKLISLPRDFWIEEEEVKLNAIYQKGLNEDQGLALSEEVVGEVLGLNIPYAVRIDFSGFVRAVDLLGGIEIEVEKSFDDYLYPIPRKENDTCDLKEEILEIDEQKARELGVSPGQLKVLTDPEGQIATAAAEPNQEISFSENTVSKYFPCRFEHLNFQKGRTVMDGESALKFVRSRHGTNGEGSDFARSRRQQAAIIAFKEKVFSQETLLDPAKMISLLKTFGASIDTDIPSEHYLAFIKLLKDLETVESTVVDALGEKPLLISPLNSKFGAFVLVPASGNYDNIRQFVQDFLK